VYACGNDYTCGSDIDGVSMASVSDDFGDDVAERTCKRGELFVGRMEEFFLCKNMNKGGVDGDLHAKVDDDNVGVVEMVEDVLGSVK